MIIKSSDYFTYSYLHDLFAISNIGVIKYQDTNNNDSSDSIIQLGEHYVASSVRDTRMTGRIFVGISTVDGCLCCGISFNDKYYSRHFVAQLTSAISSLVEALIV